MTNLITRTETVPGSQNVDVIEQDWVLKSLPIKTDKIPTHDRVFFIIGIVSKRKFLSIYVIVYMLLIKNPRGSYGLIRVSNRKMFEI